MKYERLVTQLLAAANSSLPKWFSAGLVIFLSFSLAQLTWKLIPAVGGTQGSRVEVSEMPWSHGSRPAHAGSDVPLASIAQWHLFGFQHAVKREAAPVEAPESHLNLKLQGVIAGGEGMAYAIIASASQVAHVYRVGDGVPGGATLKAVYKDHVLLSRGGRLESLKLPRKTAQGISVAPDNGANPVAATPDLGPKSRAYLQHLRRNPRAVFRTVRISPVFKDGAVEGYRLIPVRQRALYKRLGLKSGDIVTQINGITLSNPANLAKAMRALSKASRLTLLVQRGGQSRTVTINIGS